MNSKVLLVDKKVLVVEGRTEVFVIPYLMELNGVNWGKGKNNTAVHIKDYDGYENINKPDAIATELLASGLTALGIIIDADEDPKERWQSIRNSCQQSISNLPLCLPKTGLIWNAPNGIKFGIWMMPDNNMRGMLETFLAYMIPNETELLWQFAQESVKEAKTKGANFTEFQIDKANIYTWLAWQNPSGRQLHQAVMEKILDPKHPRAEKFVNWFKDLYEL